MSTRTSGAATPTTTTPPPRRYVPTFSSLYQRFGMGLVLLALIVILALIAPNFLSATNLLDVARQVSVVAILAAGATFVILTAGIDLSVGSALGVCAMVVVSLDMASIPTVVAIAAAIAAGALIGAINGVLVTKFALPAFIVTLAALTYLRGIVYVGTDGTTLFSPDLGFTWLGQGAVAGIPVPVLIMALVYAVGWFLLNRTVFGRHVFSVGSNSEAARLAGIPVRKVTFLVYLLAGVCVGIAAVIAAARLQSAVPDLGTGYELNAIAAVVLGGTSLMGGRGTLIGTLIGAFIIGVLTNGMTLMNVPSFYQLIVQGIVIVIAVGLDQLRVRKAHRQGAAA